jgi:hypothetical protein
VVAISIFLIVQSNRIEVDITQTSPSSSGVHVSVDYKEYAQKYSAADQELIRDAFIGKIGVDLSKKSGSYGAVARSGSYTESSSEPEITISELIFDIKELAHTYIVRFDGQADQDYHVLSIRCAPQSQQIDQVTTCKDNGDD